MTAAFRLSNEPEGSAPHVLEGSDAFASRAFDLPDARVAHEPPEARGLSRDAVRLLVSDAHDDSVRHATARALPEFLRAGDVLVVNASATINGALDGWRTGIDGAPDEMIAVHLSSPVPHSDDDHQWVIELRQLTSGGTRPLLDAHFGEVVRLRGGGSVTLLRPFATRVDMPNAGIRLWEAEISCRASVLDYASEFGAPIRYDYVPERWPLYMYQTMFGFEPGSAEMPSAGRPFTASLVMQLQAKGVTIAPIVLHTGVASLEAGEPPYPERYRVTACTADAVNQARRAGGRVVAVGTTVVRALETVADETDMVHPGEGWTDLVVSPNHHIRAIDALITGFHEPRASHLAMLESIAGRRHLMIAYKAALEEGYLWHEFGDVHLVIGNRE